MKPTGCAILTVLAAIAASPAAAQGTTPLALVQQFDRSGNGQPLGNCLLYVFVAGTVATPQAIYGDIGLTQALPNPVSCDASGRVPLHYLASGSTHVRLTDAAGVVQIDATLATLGTGGGGGGGGGVADPSSVAATGDIKFRLSAESLTGWVRLNGQTIGAVGSGATERAATDTQALFVYLWTNCINSHCAVTGGRGATALGDFNANKQIALPDMRGRMMAGRDCMGATCAGILNVQNITSGGTDGVDTAGAGGGVAMQTASTNIQLANFPASLVMTINSSGGQIVSIPPAQGAHSHTIPFVSAVGFGGGGSGGAFSSSTTATSSQTLPAMTGSINGTVVLTGGGGSNAVSSSFSDMSPFLLGTFYQKL